MTETVEFRLEQSLPELEDLVEKELFTQDEIRAIIKKRSEHEHALLRRTAKKTDFLRYIQYELNLETLRKKRKNRKSKRGPPPKTTISDYAGLNKIRNIFQRAMTRFQDMELWLQYIEFSKSLKSAKLTGKLFGEALQVFPSSSELWILAAQYEYETNSNISGARNLLLRSIRMNSEKRELWHEYAKLECLYILKIMDRRRILGLDKEVKNIPEEGFDLHADKITLPTITAEETQQQQKEDGGKFDPALISALTDVKTNPALNGAIPLAVYSSALESRSDDLALVAGFYDVFLPFHSWLSFIDSALDTVKKDLEEKFPNHGKTLFIEIIDHARGIGFTSKRFPGVMREMIKTSSDIEKLPVKERKECCKELIMYLQSVARIKELDSNLKIAINIFEQKVEKWQDS